MRRFYKRVFAPVLAGVLGLLLTMIAGGSALFVGIIVKMLLSFRCIASRPALASSAPALWGKVVDRLAWHGVLRAKREVRFVGVTPSPVRGDTVVVFGNHASNFSLTSLVASIGERLEGRCLVAVGKIELTRPWQRTFPFVNWQYFVIGLPCLINDFAVFIDRTLGTRALETIRDGVACLPRPFGLLLFCDGTRSKDGRVGRYKSGGLWTCVEVLPPGKTTYIEMRTTLDRPQHRLRHLLDLFGATVSIEFEDVTSVIPTGSKEDLELWLNTRRELTQIFSDQKQNP